jgi:hypothetical protein
MNQYKFTIGDTIVKAKCFDGEMRENGKVVNRRFTSTDTEPAYLVAFNGELHHVDQSNIKEQ